MLIRHLILYIYLSRYVSARKQRSDLFVLRVKEQQGYLSTQMLKRQPAKYLAQRRNKRSYWLVLHTITLCWTSSRKL